MEVSSEALVSTVKTVRRQDPARTLSGLCQDSVRTLSGLCQDSVRTVRTVAGAPQTRLAELSVEHLEAVGTYVKCSAAIFSPITKISL